MATWGDGIDVVVDHESVCVFFFFIGESCLVGLLKVPWFGGRGVGVQYRRIGYRCPIQCYSVRS